MQFYWNWAIGKFTWKVHAARRWYFAISWIWWKIKEGNKQEGKSILFQFKKIATFQYLHRMKAGRWNHLQCPLIEGVDSRDIWMSIMIQAVYVFWFCSKVKNDDSQKATSQATWTQKLLSNEVRAVATQMPVLAFGDRFVGFDWFIRGISQVKCSSFLPTGSI